MLTIFDASGNVVNKIAISDRTDAMLGVSTIESAGSRRIVGTWDLTDRKGRAVSDGTYLIKGVITVDGKKEKVSLVLGVR